MDAIRPTDLHKLEGYRPGLDLYRQILKILSFFPKGEADLKSQMRRAARSIPMNSGEGAGKRSRGRIAAYEIALGEAKEIMVTLDIALIDELAPIDEIRSAQQLADRQAAILTRLIQAEERAIG